jgi:hypothetical protein
MKDPNPLQSNYLRQLRARAEWSWILFNPLRFWAECAHRIGRAIMRAMVMRIAG